MLCVLNSDASPSPAVPQRPVQLELPLRQNGQLGVVAPPLRFRDLRSQIPDFRLNLPLLQAHNRPQTVSADGGLVSARKPLPERPLGRILNHIHRVAHSPWPGPAAPQTRQVPQIVRLRVTASAAIRRASSCSGSVMASARSNTRSTSVSVVVRTSTWSRRRSAACRSSSRRRIVDPQLLRGIRGKLIPHQLLRNAPDMRQQVVHRLQLLLRRAPGNICRARSIR